MTKNTPYLEPGQPEIVKPRPNTEPVFGEVIAKFGSQMVFHLGPPKLYTHRIYARLKGKGRYYALDIKNGNTVVNLIYASTFEQPDALRAVEKLRAENPEWEFQVRKI